MKKKENLVGVFAVLLLVVFAGIGFLKTSYSIADTKEWVSVRSFNTGLWLYQGDWDTGWTANYYEIRNKVTNQVYYMACSDKDVPFVANDEYLQYDFEEFINSTAFNVSVREENPSGLRWENVGSAENQRKFKQLIAFYTPATSATDENFVNLKSFLQNNYANIYTSKGLNNLTYDEANSMFAAAVYHFSEANMTFSACRSSDINEGRCDEAVKTRTDALFDIFIQRNVELPSISGGTYNPTFNVIQNLTWENGELFAIINSGTGFSTGDSFDITFKTNNNDTISASRTTVSNGYKYTFSSVTYEAGTYRHNNKTLTSISASVTATSSTVYDANVYVLVPDSENSQVMVGKGDETPKSKNINLSLSVSSVPEIFISKVDIANNNIDVVGAQLRIIDLSNNTEVETWVTTSEKHSVRLQDGNYRLEERIPADGYATAEKINFTVSNGKVNGSSDVVMQDQRLNVCIAKKGSDGNNYLANAKFELYNNSNELVATFTTSEDKYCFNADTTKDLTNKKIKIGNFTLKEVEAPEGYNIVNNEIEIEIKDVTTEQLFEVVNVKKPGEIVISKRDIANTDIYVVGARLVVTNIDTNQVVDSWVTVANENHTVEVSDGRYKLEETITADGYATTEKIEFEVVDGKVATGNSIIMKDERLKVCIGKKGSDSTGYLAGAKFELYNSTNELVATFTTGEDKYCFNTDTTKDLTNKKIKAGMFTLKEIEAPEGYIIVNETTPIEIKDVTGEQLFEVVDVKKPGEVVITKRDIANTDIYVVGAELTITNKDTNEIVDSWVTKDGEDHTIEINDGKYILEETITADGYATSEEIEFEVVDGKVATGNYIVMKDARLDVCIAKKASGSDKDLSGARFEMYNSDGELVASFNSSDEPYCFNTDETNPITNKMIKVGQYTIKEIEAPEGYTIKKEETVIDIRDTNDLQLFTIYNDVIVPKTDRDMADYLYIIVIAFGAIGLGTIIFLNYKKTKNELK